MAELPRNMDKQSLGHVTTDRVIDNYLSEVIKMPTHIRASKAMAGES